MARTSTSMLLSQENAKVCLGHERAHKGAGAQGVKDSSYITESFFYSVWVLVSSLCLPSSREELGEQQTQLDAAAAWVEELHIHTPTQ